MEKKNPVRGLEDISRMFLTSEDDSIPKESSPVFLSAPVRKESCSACLNVVEDPNGPLKCEIFSYKNEVDGGLVLKTIMPGYAKYCRYFDPGEADKKDRKETRLKAVRDEPRIEMEVEETISRQKKIMLNDDAGFQSSIEKILSQHLEAGYSIVRIELEKREEHNDSGCRINSNETVTILKKSVD